MGYALQLHLGARAPSGACFVLSISSICRKGHDVISQLDPQLFKLSWGILGQAFARHFRHESENACNTGVRKWVSHPMPAKATYHVAFAALIMRRAPCTIS